MRTLQTSSFIQVMLNVMITTPVNKHHHLVDVNRFILMYVHILGSTPWTMGVDPSLLIATWKKTGLSSREDSIEQLDSIEIIGLNMPMDL